DGHAPLALVLVLHTGSFPVTRNGSTAHAMMPTGWGLARPAKHLEPRMISLGSEGLGFRQLAARARLWPPPPAIHVVEARPALDVHRHRQLGDVREARVHAPQQLDVALGRPHRDRAAVAQRLLEPAQPLVTVDGLVGAAPEVGRALVGVHDERQPALL